MLAVVVQNHPNHYLCFFLNLNNIYWNGSLLGSCMILKNKPAKNLFLLHFFLAFLNVVR